MCRFIDDRADALRPRWRVKARKRIKSLVDGEAGGRAYKKHRPGRMSRRDGRGMRRRMENDNKKADGPAVRDQ